MVLAADPEFAFSNDTDFCQWQPPLRNALIDVLGIDHGLPLRGGGIPLNSKMTLNDSNDAFDTSRVEFQSEPGQSAPGQLLKPKRSPVRCW